MITGPFRGSKALRLGLVTPGRLRGPRYRRLFSDVYVAAATELTTLVWSLAAYVLVEHRGGALGGWSAAELLGAGCSPRSFPAEVIAPAGGLRTRSGLLVRREQLDPVDVVVARGCRTTTPLRTAWDLARRLDLVEAVVAVDALARRGGFDPAELLALRARIPGARRCRRLEHVLALANPLAESPMETRLRLLLVLAGLPAPVVQHRILDEYGFVLARVDLAYPDVRLAIEYDGSSHFSAERGRRDRARDNLVAKLGWETMRFVDDDVLRRRRQTVVDVEQRLLTLAERHTTAVGS